jgi:hypothetical protein
VIDKIKDNKADPRKSIEEEIWLLVVDLHEDGRGLNGRQEIALGERSDDCKTRDVKEYKQT